MKVFYGVQGTGNGHITRARIMAKELVNAGIDVTFLFSGRPRDDYFDMEIFNDFEHRHGLTFHVNNGEVNYLQTLLKSKPITFIKEISSLDLNGYDLIISDFEPVTAWAGKRHRQHVLGIGHQYAFDHAIPKAGADPLARMVMKLFAPVKTGLGLHWHHFDQPILPPLVEIKELPGEINKNKIMVYLPFEDPADVIKLLIPFSDFEFHIYTDAELQNHESHIQVKALSREGFQLDLHDCAGIISNAGFELASESLQLGKKILAKPLASQMEQISNAAALQQLGYGHTTKNLHATEVEQWLYHNQSVRITYPNVAQAIVKWIEQGMQPMNQKWINKLWDSVEVLHVAL